MGFDEWKAQRSAVWSSAPFERVVHQLEPIHSAFIARVAPWRGERWLDVATGTGEIALRAARAGAEVTAIDFAATLLETARRRAAEERLSIAFDLGDAEELPYGDSSFDVVVSSVGAIFAPDHVAVARELARVSRPGGRLGMAAWRPGSELARLVDRFRPPGPEGAGNPDDWGREEYVRGLLGESFELTFAEGDCPLVGESGEEIWQLVTSSVGPMKDVLQRLEAEQRDELHSLEVDFLERHRAADGVRYPQPYLLILGQRR